ncbi:PEGA domain-containing protein [Sandaracinus amylolyticus]|uniref:PEGA domain-containing protein n=1 Tax=Sandaracinus amylolyticus TaxID=927083 RepID=UPI001F28FBE2|nr:PEGA domain-containing protein [Sandaracinus amylolyticus]UJR78682.1 PEGA domain protein [Sandaracinus amylolyticus]
MRALALALALLIALVPAVHVAAAQDDEARRTAREAYRRGEDAFARGEHTLALAIFRELYERTGHDAVRYNVGVCLEQLGRAREARIEFLAVAESEAVPAETRAQALEAAARVRARLASIEVRGAPEGAGVTIDGVRVCALPCDELIDPGTHTIALDVPEGPSEEIEIAAGATRTIELAVPVVASDEPTPPVSSRGSSLGALTVIGASLTAIGTGGVIGFGIYTMDLKSRFDAMPTQALADEGNTMAALTNASIGVLALGGALVLIDVILVVTSGPSEPSPAVSLEGGTLRVAF